LTKAQEYELFPQYLRVFDIAREEVEEVQDVQPTAGGYETWFITMQALI
jgi:hypothetical protein